MALNLPLTLDALISMACGRRNKSKLDLFDQLKISTSVSLGNVSDTQPDIPVILSETGGEMTNSKFRLAIGKIRTLAFGAVALTCIGTSSVYAEKITVVDIAGRTVEVEKDVQRVVLGEGRMIYSLAVLDDNPFERIVGWKDDLILYDPDAYRKYVAIFPEAADIANLGSPYASEYSLEKIISMDTQLVILNLGKLLDAQESGIIDKLAKAGIPVVFVDYRQRPTSNTVPSLLLMGKVFDRRDKADEFIDFYTKQMMSVYSVVESIADEDKPLVFIERAAGNRPDRCCGTFGSANMGRLVDLSGGINWGTRKFPGFAGNVNPEAIFADDPDVIIGTGANWAENRPESQAVPFGYDAEPAVVQERLIALASRKGWSEIKAVKDNRYYSVYHQFYNSPYHFVVLQRFAKWFHPELFEDVDPEANFQELHDRFLPIDNSGIFWAGIEK